MAKNNYRVSFLFGVSILGMTLLTMSAQAQQPSITFNKDILPIMQKNCQSCHRPGQIGPFSMLNYTDVRPWAKAIKTAVVSRTMPPWLADPNYGHFENDRSLRREEVEKIAAWVDAGAPEGDSKDAPPPAKWPDGGWQITPDVVVDLPPFTVPPRGVLDWEILAIPSPFKEDTWVTSVETLPGEASVVHHFCFGFEKHFPTTMYNTYEWMEVPRDETGVAINHGGREPEGIVATREVGGTEIKRRRGRPVLPASGNADFCYLPGLPYQDYRPMNAGFLVRAGSDIILSLHYTTNGLSVTDKTKIGFTVAKIPPAKQVLPQGGEEGRKADTAPIQQKSKITELAIPPNEGSYQAPLTEITFLKDVDLISLTPHGHMRAKSVSYKLIYPDGREEIVLKVPRYDFNWQLMYRTSLKIPKGSRMEVQFVYDNSPANKYNPDASKWVYYGQQSWEEMGTPFLGLLVDRGQKP